MYPHRTAYGVFVPGLEKPTAIFDSMTMANLWLIESGADVCGGEVRAIERKEELDARDISRRPVS